MKITRTVRLATSGGLAVALLAVTSVPAEAVEVDAVLLKPYVQQTQPMPGPQGHDYRYPTTTNFWSVVGIKPIGRNDVDLNLFDDKAQTKLLATSSFGTGQSDFIAVDSNHRPLGTYFPEVKTSFGSGQYRVELAHGSQTLDNDDETVAVSSSDVVLVRDTWLVAGEQYFFAITGVQGAVLYLMGSSPSDSSTWVRPRAFAIDSTDTGGFPIFSYTPTTSDWYGVVVTLAGTAGNVSMLRSGGPAPN